MKPSAGKYYRIRGFCYQTMGKSNLALKDYKKSLELEPRNVKGLYLLGHLYYERENFDEAVEHLQKGRNRNIRQSWRKLKKKNSLLILSHVAVDFSGKGTTGLRKDETNMLHSILERARERKGDPCANGGEEYTGHSPPTPSGKYWNNFVRELTEKGLSKSLLSEKSALRWILSYFMKFGEVENNYLIHGFV